MKNLFRLQLFLCFSSIKTTGFLKGLKYKKIFLCFVLLNSYVKTINLPIWVLGYDKKYGKKMEAIDRTLKSLKN
jgi:hypothetical protein